MTQPKNDISPTKMKNTENGIQNTGNGETPSRLLATGYWLLKNLGWIAVLCFIGAAFCYRFFLETYPWSVTVALSAGVAALLLYVIFEWKQIIEFFGKLPIIGSLNLSVVLIATLAILVIANYLAVSNNKRLDLTSAGIFSIAEQSVKVARAMDAPIDVYAFIKAGDTEGRRKFIDLTDSYRLYSDNLRPQVVNPLERQDLTQKYKISEYGAVVFDKDGETKRTSEISEEAFTRLLIELSSGEARKVYFLTGHGETDIKNTEMAGASLAKEHLENANYKVETFSLIPDATAPDDATAVVVLSPKKDFLPKEIEALRDYLKNRAGRLAIFVERDCPKNLSDFLSEWGISVQNATVIDPIGGTFFGNYFITAGSSYSAMHPVTKDFEIPTFFPFAAPLKLTKGAAGPAFSVYPEGLVFTDPNAWGDYDEDVFRFDKGVDMKGPITLAAAVAVLKEAETETEGDESELAEGRLIAVGDGDFLANQYFGISGNSDFFGNIVHWLAEQETLIGVAPSKIKASMIAMSRGETEILFYSVVFVLPVAVVVAGILIFWRRRKL